MESRSKDKTNTSKAPNYQELVPHYMRTRRKSPRVLALIVCIFSVISFSYGTNALARVQNQKKSSVLDSISSGKNTYRLSKTSDPNQCLGLINVELAPSLVQDKQSSLKIKARFHVSNSESMFPVTLKAEGKFDTLGELSKVDVRFTLGSLATLKINGPGHSDPLVATLQSAQGTTESISLFALERIYLFETTKDVYRLRLPNSLSGLSKQMRTNYGAGQLLEKATEETAQLCRSQLESANPTPILTLPLSSRGLDKSIIVNLLRSIE